GLDIARWSSFVSHSTRTTADWQFDTILARHGLASLALVPSPVEMIGQDPPLEQQGLRIADKPVELLRDDKAFDRFCERTRMIRNGSLVLPATTPQFSSDMATHAFFPHQIGLLNGSCEGEWRLKWSQGFGPFAWRAVEPGAVVEVDVQGPC